MHCLILGMETRVFSRKVDASFPLFLMELKASLKLNRNYGRKEWFLSEAHVQP